MKLLIIIISISLSFNLLARPITFEEITNNIKSDKDIMTRINKNIRFVKVSENLQMPETTMKLGYGDGKDLALLFLYCVNKIHNTNKGSVKILHNRNNQTIIVAFYNDNEFYSIMYNLIGKKEPVGYGIYYYSYKTDMWLSNQDAIYYEDVINKNKE